MPRVFLDTGPLIYLAEGAPPRMNRVRDQLAQWIRADAFIGTSTLTLLELLVVPKRKQDVRAERKYRALLAAFLSEPTAALDENAAALGAEYRAALNLRTPDAIQLATAVSRGYDVFYTNNRRLQRCGDIEILLVEP
jgi:predicted nucleic acid-binding protein